MRRIRFSLITFAVLSILLANGCNLPAPANSPTEPASVPTTPAAGTTVSGSSTEALRGIWWGILSAGSGTDYQVRLNITPGQGNSFTGTIVFSTSSTYEVYSISGSLEGDQIRFSETEGRSFWGSFDGETLVGAAGMNCYECSSWGEFSLGRGVSPSTGDIRFLDLQEDSRVSLEEGPLGPQVESRVAAAPMVPGERLFLQADGLIMDMQRSTGDGTFTTTLTWWPWHGNGKYDLELVTWPMSGCCRQAIQSISVDVSGFPDAQPHLYERFVQLYRQDFGLDLTSPVIARYVMPWEDAMDKTRWVSSAYIGDMLYEINLFDDGSTTSTSRPIGHSLPGDDPICRPAGEYDMLVAFVDYGNTGISEQQALEALATGEEGYNRFYLEQAQLAGVDQAILQVHAHGFFLDGPTIPGQVMEADEIATRTGQDLSQYDLLVEIDLDANMSATSNLPGLGFGGTGCFQDGSPYVNIFFAVQNLHWRGGFAGTIFDHELSHSLGWMHWWPNSDLGVASQVSSDQDFNASFPTRMFGWVDSDGDGVIEILDPGPYGMTP